MPTSFRTEQSEERNLLVEGEISPCSRNDTKRLSFRTKQSEERNLLLRRYDFSLQSK